MVKRDGKVVGSRLIGQDFCEATRAYFQSRPSVTGYAPAATFFNNQGPNQQELADAARRVRRRVPAPRAAVHTRA